ncbi:MAG: bifunctional 5,10-methylene-tetrahydrofolate dehydrogenase/5,10-methylene-tetrahydrofolate cyclohydrolase [Planctomycetota bacterium]|nr:bifunctional 5,10-methylene-tetrahydrofolate dehydrogenase/5,10-methylene-tetrahydrofolate cyclohydrolase [Planctomycetota bacterium]MDA1177973.1 bifunctional 5,10-methylene-tetrahydrofolate dehydrogenase/5,10-methylene-tetrahydrofolate cyclohydrolase [Planctomycetota bacterium]
MTVKLLSGTQLAATLREELKAEVSQFIDRHQIKPTLAAVLVGNDPASEVYVRNKHRASQSIGMNSQLHRLDSTASMHELLSLVNRLNADPDVHGILVQLPLPKPLDATSVLDSIHPDKDVDAFHPENVGRILQGRPRFLPCTPHGVQQLLIRNSIPISGQHVVIVGRSDIVGKPLAAMLVQRQCGYGPNAVNATVTVCHTGTRNLSEITRSGDILVAAVGQPRFITAEMVRPGATVIDVGINRVGDSLVGDVDFAAVSPIAGALSPVPGGVGPLTIAMLLRNTLVAAQLQATSRAGE